MEIDLEKIHSSWWPCLREALASPYMASLSDFLEHQLDAGKTIYPAKKDWFKAFELTPLSSVRVVIIGQDPYHGEGQAQGLSFSVPSNFPLPPSLKNIYKELYQNTYAPSSGDLTRWAEQGVLMLNAALTVEQGLAGSHAKKGWLEFTRDCLSAVNNQPSPVVFLAWGKFAHGLCNFVDQSKHCVIKTSHPSPLGATKSGSDFCAFLGSGCFAKVNLQLERWGKKPIDWLAV